MRLVADNVTVARGGQVLFSGIGFTLDAGEALIVSGPNGVGKTTLLRVLAGLLPDADGRVTLEGSACETVAEACHYLGHRNAMKRELTVGENLAFWRDFMRVGGDVPPSPDIAEAIDAVGLAGLDHLPFGFLSAGQQRRISMARLLLSYRPVWILDEPTSALDQNSQTLFADLVHRHLADGGLVVAATHQSLGLKAPRHLVLEPRAEAALVEYDPFATEAL